MTPPRLPIVLFFLLALAGLAVTLIPRGPEWPAFGTPVVPTPAAFDSTFRERLKSVHAAADALVDLGERRERNLIVVGQRQAAMNHALDITDAWLSEQVTHQDDPAVVSYRTGAAEIRQAMADAQSAFLRFDWDAIGIANEMLKQGVSDISAAEAALNSRGGG